MTLNEPAYKVTVALDRPDIDAYGRTMPLQPDMLLQADIILEQRRCMSWLIEPAAQRAGCDRDARPSQALAAAGACR